MQAQEAGKFGTKDAESVERLTAAMKDEKLDALLCALPSNVLLLSGYYPMMGTSVALLTREGEASLIVPDDESDMAQQLSGAHRRPYEPESLEAVAPPSAALATSLATLIRSAGLTHARIGVESPDYALPASYLSQYHAMGAVSRAVHASFPEAALPVADALLERQRSILTARQLDRLRTACGVAARGFAAGPPAIHQGATEGNIADAFAHAFTEGGLLFAEHAQAHLFCMSGPNSTRAHAAFAKTRRRVVENGDLVMIHCNSTADGFWTDITRTYTCGEPDDQKKKMFQAVMDAREAALGVIRPGARAADVDKAARSLLQERGYGPAFKHATGHGVGFQAAYANAVPRIHPESPDVLEVGMTFNVEPAVYIEGVGGIRHCDVVTVTKGGMEVLTDF